jgi:hypothetical protein
MVFEPWVNKGSETGWIVQPEAGISMILNDKNIEWTRCEEVANVEINYRRSKVTGHNTTSCKTAMGSICSQIRNAVKEDYADYKKKNSISEYESKRMYPLCLPPFLLLILCVHSAGDVYTTFIREIFEQVS